MVFPYGFTEVPDLKWQVPTMTNENEKPFYVKNIIKRREKLGMTQEQFSEFSRIPLSTLGEIEAGYVPAPQMKTKKRFEKAFKISFDDLYREEPQEWTPISALEAARLVLAYEMAGPGERKVIDAAVARVDISAAASRLFPSRPKLSAKGS